MHAFVCFKYYYLEDKRTEKLCIYFQVLSKSLCNPLFFRSHKQIKKRNDTNNTNQSNSITIL